MSIYAVVSMKSFLSTKFFSFAEKNHLIIHQKEKQNETIRITKCLLFARINFSLVDLNECVIISISVWSVKKKEETKNSHIHSNIHPLSGSHKVITNIEDLFLSMEVR